MTKLEHLSELLVEELHSFKQEVNRLERIEQGLKSTSIKADSTQIEKIVDSHLKKLELDQISHQENRKELLRKIKHTITIPNWLVILALLLFLSKKTCLL